MAYDTEENRLEQLSLAVSDAIDSPKQPAITSTRLGGGVVLHASWVKRASADATLDQRCVAFMRFTDQQMSRYIASNTTDRLAVEKKLKELLRERISAQASGGDGACSIDFTIPDALFANADDVVH